MAVQTDLAGGGMARSDCRGIQKFTRLGLKPLRRLVVHAVEYEPVSTRLSLL